MNLNPFDLLSGLQKKENPFRELSSDEKKKRKESEKQVKDGIKQLGLICNDILSDQRYREFANLFKDIELKLLDLMVEFDEVNRDVYYIRMRDYQQKLRFFRNILKMPHQFVERSEEIQRTEIK